ncbi:MAG: glycosyltransferase family 4 protein [Promethearchaeia archaeon]
MKKVKICLVSLTIPPDYAGGEGKFFRGIFNYLKQKGYDVTLLTGKWTFELDDPQIVQIDLIPKRFFWVPQFSYGVIKYLNSHRFDIVHGNGPKGTLPIIFSQNKQFISTIHDLGPFETPFTRFPIEKLLVKYVVDRATYITTCSEFIRREINYYMPYTSLSQIFNLYSAIEEKFKPYPREAQKLKERLGLDGPVMLYIGRVAHYKGVEDIINAYLIAKKSLPDLNLVVGGKPDFAMQETYKRWKRRYEDIRFVGFVPNEQIPYYYSMADVFVTYSHASEGFGLTPIESIACGTPVICSSLLAYKEVLQDNAVFVPPKTPKKLAKAILNLLKDEQYREDLTERAQSYITRYTWDEVGKKLEKVYAQFLENKKINPN